jgi:hypothetical protein
VRITISDTRKLAVCVIQPAADRFYNWTTTGWENPFNAANHLIPFAPVEATPSVFAGVQSVDVGMILVERQDVAAVVMTVDNSNNPIAAVDVWTLPYPVGHPAAGGWSR